MVHEPGSLVLKTPLDSAALGKLYDALYDPIWRYCLRRLYYRHVAEDAVSEIFLTMAQRIGEFRGKTLRDFRAWLYVIAANHASLGSSVRNRALAACPTARRCSPPSFRLGTWMVTSEYR